MAFIPTALLKKHLRVSGSSEDELIQDYYYPAAVAWVADYTGREIAPRQLVHTATVADGGAVTLPAYPVQTVDTVLQGVTPVTYEATDVDDNGVTTLEVSGHDVSEEITFTFTAGYADADLPLQLKQAILFMVGHFFHNRSEVDSNKMADIPEGAKRLCDPFRSRTFGGA
jgi:uncharacterized phiE125 gp8 family phage protein